MANKAQLEKLTYNQTVRITESLGERLDKAAGKLGLAKQDVVRLALDVGLAHVEKIKYNLADAILKAAEDGAKKKKQ